MKSYNSPEVQVDLLLDILRSLLEDYKQNMDLTCDHDVGLCVCSAKQLVFDAERIIAFVRPPEFEGPAMINDYIQAHPLVSQLGLLEREDVPYFYARYDSQASPPSPEEGDAPPTIVELFEGGLVVARCPASQAKAIVDEHLALRARQVGLQAPKEVTSNGP